MGSCVLANGNSSHCFLSQPFFLQVNKEQKNFAQNFAKTFAQKILQNDVSIGTHGAQGFIAWARFVPAFAGS